MLTLHAQLKAAAERDLGRSTPSTFPSQDVDTFPADYMLYNLLRKEEPFAEKDEVPTAVLRDSLSKFAESEWRCRVVNLCGRFYTPLVKEDEVFFSEAIRLARSWISRTMMEHWPSWEDARYTSGASRNSSRQQSMAYLKWAGITEKGRMSATTSALDIVESMIAPEFGSSWKPAKVELVNDCRFDFVHKTAKAVRFITPQPEYNLLAQTCVGDCIRKALKVVGIDLDDQTRNQNLAYIGSITRDIATIDLTNSSDNIAMVHGEELLPERIMDYCLATRVTHTTVGDVSHRLNKIATMGNGFIMELQTLIYAGLAHAVTALTGGSERDIAVYGDDIVISTASAQPLMDLLVYLGMEPNFSKSYWGDVPFRESCGKHYIAGRDVTPFYVKAPLVDEDGKPCLRSVFRAINGLMYWQNRTGLRLRSTIKLLVDLLSKKDRIVVPREYSIDCGLHFAVSGCTLPKRIVTPHGDKMIEFRVLTDPVQDIRERISDDVLYYDWLRSPPKDLIPENIWSKVREIRFWSDRYACFPRFHHSGGPRDRKSYSRVLDLETNPATWVARKCFPGNLV